MKTLKADLQKKADGGDEKAKGRLEGFEGKAQGFAKKIIANFKDYEFYTGESFNPDAMVVLKNYRVCRFVLTWDTIMKLMKRCWERSLCG